MISRVVDFYTCTLPSQTADWTLALLSLQTPRYKRSFCCLSNKYTSLSLSQSLFLCLSVFYLYTTGKRPVLSVSVQLLKYEVKCLNYASLLFPPLLFSLLLISSCLSCVSFTGRVLISVDCLLFMLHFTIPTAFSLHFASHIIILF